MLLSEKILQGEKLSEREKSQAISLYTIHEEELDSGRWHNYKNTVIKIPEQERYFSIYWGEGLTEHQDDYLEEDFVEVKKVVKEVLIPEHVQTVVSYEPVEDIEEQS